MIDDVGTILPIGLCRSRRPAVQRGLGAVAAILGLLSFSAIAISSAADAAPSKETRKRWSMTRMGRPNMVPEREGTHGRPMAAAEVRKLFSGKTWLWQGGGGYLDPSGSFIGVVGNDAATGAYAEGKWEVNDKGQLCHSEEWNSRSGKSNATTCYSHHSWGKAIYQRKEPDGAWYVFQSARARKADPANNLVQGNRIIDQVRQVQPTIASR
jgi:hypothetical protein